jgi:hypothetical protein
MGGSLVRSVGTHRLMGGGMVRWVAAVKNSVQWDRVMDTSWYICCPDTEAPNQFDEIL